MPAVILPSIIPKSQLSTKKEGRYHAGDLGRVYSLNVGYARSQPDRRPCADVPKYGPGIVDGLRWRHVRLVVGHPHAIDAEFLCPHPLVRSFSRIRDRGETGKTDIALIHVLLSFKD